MLSSGTRNSEENGRKGGAMMKLIIMLLLAFAIAVIALKV